MKRLFLMAIQVVIVLGAKAQVENICLNGEWRFMADNVENYAMGLPAKAVAVKVPHTWNVMDGLEDYMGRAWYERELTVPADLKGRKLRLRFEAVYHDAVVYINGQNVGEHRGKGFTPFSFDVTKYVRPGQKNRLVVMADNSFSEMNLPYKRAFDWAADGGIFRSVSLHVSGQQSIRYAHFTPLLNTVDSTGSVHLSIRLWESKVSKATFDIKISSKQTGRIVYEQRHMVKRDADGTFDMDIDCGRVTPWHFDNPALYSYEVSVISGREVSDTNRGQIGFREFKIEGNRFVLNGEPVRLPGIENMAGSHPDFGMAEPKEYIVQTATMMKDLNCTITRFHWFQGEAMLNALDSLGILTQQELPWWQQPNKELSPDLYRIAEEALEEAIEAYYNHPCIFAWAVSNEVGNNHEQVRLLGALCKKLDPQRMTETVGNYIHKNLVKDASLLLDIPTWNEYIGSWHGLKRHVREELPQCFEMIRPVMQGRPLFITEFGLCEPAFVGGDRRRIDDMLYHIKEWGNTDFVTGYIYFCLEDYRTQMGEEGLLRHRIRRHGITDYRHNPKPSYYVLRDLMCPVEIDKVQPSTAVRDKKTLAGVWETKKDDRTLIIGIKVKNTIPSYVLRGYTIKYTDANGKQMQVSLPVMQPGKRYDIALPNINDRFKFDVCRSGGSACLNY